MTSMHVEITFRNRTSELQYLNYSNNKLYCVISVFYGLYVKYSVYFADDVDEHKITFKPLISMRGTPKAFCVQNDFVCLFMNVKGYFKLFIYALNESFSSSLNLKEYITDRAINIFRCREEGVYIVTESSILQIDIQINDNKIAANVIDTWTIKTSGIMESQIRFEITEDKIFRMLRDENKLYYQKLPMKIGLLYKEERIEIKLPHTIRFRYTMGDVVCDRVLLMRLPEDSLGCHTDCPHCRLTYEGRDPSYNGDDDSDEYEYSDDHYENTLKKYTDFLCCKN